MIFGWLPHFRYPLVLALLILPLGLMVWHAIRSGRHVVVPVDHMQNQRGLILHNLLTFFQWMAPLVLAAVIIILAGPTRFAEPEMERSVTNIEFCVDVSGSMTAGMGEGTRYDASMAAINQFVDLRKGDAFGLTFFGNEVVHWVPVTRDVSAVTCAVPFMDPKNPNHPRWLGGTEIGKALLACRTRLLEQESGDRMIVLVSDGYSSDLAGGNDMKIANTLSQDGIIVFGIHVAEGEVPAEVVNIAMGTGGDAFPAGDTEALEKIFKRIDAMKPATMKKSLPSATDFYEPFIYFAGGAMVLLVLAGFGMRYTPW